MKFILAPAAVAAVVLAVLPSGAAQAKSVGGCPTQGGYTMVTVESLGITPETAGGIASLDGNGDGMTCTKLIADGKILIFRDNTVQA